MRHLVITVLRDGTHDGKAGIDCQPSSNPSTFARRHPPRRGFAMTWLGRAAMALAVRCRRGGVIINEHVPSADETRRHVEALARWFDFIALDQLSGRLAAPGRRPFCLLTFDDGKRSNVTACAPELERAGVPAVFYVVTGFLTDGRPLWFDRYRVLVARLGAAPAGLEAESVKRLPYATLLARLDEACARHGVEPDPTADDVRPMSWDDARALRRRGFEIGAHGVTHAILTLEPIEEARSSIRDSLATVAAEVGRCTTFAFPNGNYTPELAQVARAAGATTVMTVEPTWVDQARPLWRLPRVQLFGPNDAGRIGLKLAVAATGRILANPDGTGRRYAAGGGASRADAELSA
jgi:peptidoglycan/xylan/chitin deacetylase (PgdA/CDA1 family)